MMKYYYYHFRQQEPYYEFWTKTIKKIDKNFYYPIETIVHNLAIKQILMYGTEQATATSRPKKWEEITEKEYFKIRTAAII